MQREEGEEEARTRQVIERKRSVTDLQECWRVTLPKPLPVNDNNKRDTQQNIWR